METWLEPLCESRLSIDPTPEALKFCQIKLDYHNRQYWKALRSLGGWLYSVGSNTTITIKCPSNNNLVEITGAGIMQLLPGCSAKTRKITLPAISSTGGVTEVIYESNAELNLRVLSPAIVKLTMDERVQNSLETRSVSLEEAQKFLENSKTLGELERQFNEFSIQTKNQRDQEELYKGIYIGAFIIIVLLVVTTYVVRKIINCKKERTPKIEIVTPGARPRRFLYNKNKPELSSSPLEEIDVSNEEIETTEVDYTTVEMSRRSPPEIPAQTLQPL